MENARVTVRCDQFTAYLNPSSEVARASLPAREALLYENNFVYPPPALADGSIG